MALIEDLPNKIYDGILEEIPSLESKVVAVTGCTTGTGYWLARAAIEKNVKALILLNRPSERSEKLAAELNEIATNTEIHNVPCNLMSLDSVREAAAEVNGLVGPLGGLHVLANNAGIMAFPDIRTQDGYDVQMQTNHIGHFLLTHLLLGALEQASVESGQSRVVQHSSNARLRQSGSENNIKGELEAMYFQKSEPGSLGGDAAAQAFGRYHQTKLANTVFAMVLHEKFQERGLKIKSIVAEPGVAATKLMDNLVDGQSTFNVFKMLPFIRPVFNFVASFVVQSAADGACPIMVACFDPEAESGDFFIPKNIRTGIPIRTIAQGRAVKEGGEELTLDPMSHKLLWEVSEAAIGTDFFSTLE